MVPLRYSVKPNRWLDQSFGLQKLTQSNLHELALRRLGIRRRIPDQPLAVNDSAIWVT
jgi:hypothetical protein